MCEKRWCTCRRCCQCAIKIKMLNRRNKTMHKIQLLGLTLVFIGGLNGAAAEIVFDEINFDYVRFASDGDLSNIEFPFWDKKTARSKIIASFFEYLRGNLGEAKLS